MARVIGSMGSQGYSPLGQVSGNYHVVLQGPGLRIFAASVCLFIFLASAFLDLFNGFFGVAIVSGALLLAFPTAGRSSLASIVVITGIAVFAMPQCGLIMDGRDVQTAWYALYVLATMVLVIFEEPRMEVTSIPGHGGIDLPAIAFLLVAGLWFWGNEGLQQVSFFAGWAIALIHLERIHANSRSLLFRGTGLLLFAAVIAYFMIALWQGGGRIVQLSFALAPILLTVHYRTFPLNGLFLAGAAVVLSFAGRLMRFGWSDGLRGLAEDSGASGIESMSYLWETEASGWVGGSIWEQWVLLFLNWFPRDLWPGKPLGIGSTYVDDVVGRAGVSAEHNLAIGFFGEHMLYLPYFWIVSVALLVAVIIFLRRALVRVSAPYRAPVIILDVWLITLFWGGMAAFAARTWFALLPVIPYVLLIKALDGRSRSAARVGERDGAPEPLRS